MKLECGVCHDMVDEVVAVFIRDESEPRYYCRSCFRQGCVNMIRAVEETQDDKVSLLGWVVLALLFATLIALSVWGR